MHKLTLKIFLRQQLAMLPVVPAALYLVVLLYSPESSRLIQLTEIWGPALLLPTGVVLPLAIIHILTRWARGCPVGT